MCNRGDLLVSYVYDEISDRDRRDVEAHLAGCAECREEIEGLRSTRSHLTLWAPPQPDLGFRIIRGGAAGEPIAALPRRRWAPAFAFAAAAVIVLAVAAAIANVDVQYGPEGLSVRTGWARGTQPAALADATQPAANLRPVAGTEFAELIRRLDHIERTLAQNPSSAAVQSASTTTFSEAAILRQVREIVREAETRQQNATNRLLLQVATDFDAQRRMDIQNIQRGLGQYQTLTNAEIASQRDSLIRVNEYIRANSKQER